MTIIFALNNKLFRKNGSDNQPLNKIKKIVFDVKYNFQRK